MKIYISHSKILNFKEELYKPLKMNEIYQEHEFILPHDVHEKATDFVTRDIIKHIDLFIAEVSYPSTGQGIELGWADSCGCPIVCLHKKGVGLSDSLQVVCKKFLEYEDVSDMIEKIVLLIRRGV